MSKYTIAGIIYIHIGSNKWGKCCTRERETDRETETDRDRDRDRETERQRELELESFILQGL